MSPRWEQSSTPLNQWWQWTVKIQQGICGMTGFLGKMGEKKRKKKGKCWIVREAGTRHLSSTFIKAILLLSGLVNYILVGHCGLVSINVLSCHTEKLLSLPSVGTTEVWACRSPPALPYPTSPGSLASHQPSHWQSNCQSWGEGDRDYNPKYTDNDER